MTSTRDVAELLRHARTHRVPEMGCALCSAVQAAIDMGDAERRLETAQWEHRVGDIKGIHMRPAAEEPKP